MRATRTLSWPEPKTRQRLIQLLVSMVATVAVLLLFDIPKIIDDMPRVYVSRLMPRDASGEIVMIETETGIGDSRSVAELQAQAVQEVDRLNPRLIMLEGRFDRDDVGIPALTAAIAKADSPIGIAWPTLDDTKQASQTDLILSKGANRELARSASLPVEFEAADINRLTITGYVLDASYNLDVGDKRYQSFPTVLSGVDGKDGSYPIDYRFTLQSIPSYSVADLRQPDFPPSAIAGKRVVIASSSLRGLQTTVNSPTRHSMRIVMVNILAAETLLGDTLTPIPWAVPFAAFAALLATVLLLPTTFRRIGYAALVLLSLAMPLVTAYRDLLVPAGMVYTMFVIFAAIRVRSNWRERAAGMDKASGLPNFTALEADFPHASGRLVIARIDKYEEILASLEPQLHRIFILQIAQRLAIGNETQIYTDSTGHFAWFDEMEHARSHITGLLALASAPIRVEDRTLDFACAFGIHDDEIVKVRQAISATIVAAEIANRRPNRIAMVSEQGDDDADWQLSLHSSLDHAIAHQHIYLLFQPQCLLDTGHVVGAEALVRWKHPERGEISPTQFIPYIEKAGRLKPLTAHTLRLAARSANVAINAGARISVNISATLLAEPDFVSLICDNVSAGGGRPEAITIEITETAKIENFRLAAHNLGILRNRGFHVSLDDFGTGEANLSLLVELPCDEIKIDRSFVALATHNDRARIVITALAETARKANMRLIAEGIETPEEQALLVSLGCSIGQGFLFGRPMRFPQLLEMVGDLSSDDVAKLTLY